MEACPSSLTCICQGSAGPMLTCSPSPSSPSLIRGARSRVDAAVASTVQLLGGAPTAGPSLHRSSYGELSGGGGGRGDAAEGGGAEETVGLLGAEGKAEL